MLWGRGIDSRNRVWNEVAKLLRLAGRYDNPMPPWFLAPIAGLKLPTQVLKPVVSLQKAFKTVGSVRSIRLECPEIRQQNNQKIRLNKDNSHNTNASNASGPENLHQL